MLGARSLGKMANGEYTRLQSLWLVGQKCECSCENGSRELGCYMPKGMRGGGGTYRIENQHLGEEVDRSVGDGWGEGVQLPKGAGFSLGEETLHGVTRGHMGNILQAGGTKQVCYHFQLSGGEGGSRVTQDMWGISEKQ